MAQLSPHCLPAIMIAVTIGFIPAPALSQTDGQSDGGGHEEPDLPQAFKALSTRDLEGTYTKIHYQTSLIQSARDTDKGWLALKKSVESAGVNVAYPFDIRLSTNSKTTYALVCDSGGSADPSCSLYHRIPTQKIKPAVTVPGLAFVFPGDGGLYVAGHTDNMFDTRRKFCEDGANLSEVPQPLKHVGLKSTAGRNLDIFGDRALTQKTETIPADAFIEVIAEDHGAYLVRDEFGITGWLKIEEDKNCQQTTDIGGLCYAGD